MLCVCVLSLNHKYLGFFPSLHTQIFSPFLFIQLIFPIHTFFSDLGSWFSRILKAFSLVFIFRTIFTVSAHIFSLFHWKFHTHVFQLFTFILRFFLLFFIYAYKTNKHLQFVNHNFLCLFCWFFLLTRFSVMALTIFLYPKFYKNMHAFSFGSYRLSYSLLRCYPQIFMLFHISTLLYLSPNFHFPVISQFSPFYAYVHVSCIWKSISTSFLHFLAFWRTLRLLVVANEHLGLSTTFLANVLATVLR